MIENKRLANEIEHGKFLKRNDAGAIWNWTSAAGKLRWARRLKMLTQNIQSSDIVLELGCGEGFFTHSLYKKARRTFAIDISRELLYKASQVRRSNTLYYIETDACTLSFPDERFDCVVGSSVLHHLEIEKALPEIYRVLKSGGDVYFTEPNMLNPQIMLQKNIPFLKRLSGDSPDETAFFRWPLTRMLKKNGFLSVTIEPFDFLHPGIPGIFLPFLQTFCYKLETIPLLREIAGSLFIRAQKP